VVYSVGDVDVYYMMPLGLEWWLSAHRLPCLMLYRAACNYTSYTIDRLTVGRNITFDFDFSPKRVKQIVYSLWWFN
jgi:hypothetical protein